MIYYEISGGTFCYPFHVSEPIKKEDGGILSGYIGNKYSREEIDKIICEMVTRHPYIDYSMFMEINFIRVDKTEEHDRTSLYQSLTFENESFGSQKKNDTYIKYEIIKIN